jgi:hypothetical protein
MLECFLIRIDCKSFWPVQRLFPFFNHSQRQVDNLVPKVIGISG